MTNKKRIGKKVWIIIVVALVIQILFDPLSNLMHWGEKTQARVSLPYARRRWDAQNIAHYKFDFKAYVPLVCIVGGSVEVKDGVVIHTGPSSDARSSQFLDAGFTGFEDLFLCNYRNYTMPDFFDEVERYIKESPNIISGISFDPKYGFISSFGFGSSGGNGLLSPKISDCCGGFSIRNFQVLDE